MKIRGIKYIRCKMQSLLLAVSLFWLASLLSPVFGQSNVRHYGGKNDGYTKGCVAPAILSVKPLKNGGCVEDGELFISVVATGTDISYQWQKQSGTTGAFENYFPGEESKVEGMDGPTLRFIKTTELDNGYYRCVLSNQCSEEVVSDTFLVAISSRPVIKSGLFDRDVCVGEKIMYNVVAEALGEQKYTYQWYKNGNVIAGETNSFYTFNAAASKKTTDVYVVKVTNKCGSVRDTSVLTISTLPQIESYNDMAWVCRDSSVTLSVKLKEGGDYTYELYKVIYPSLTEVQVWQGVTNSYILKSVTESGVYRWKVRNECGVTSSELIEVKVEDVPVISLHPQSDTVCEGTSVLLSCTALPATSQILNYVWYKDGVPGVKTTQNYLRIRNITDRDAGAYRCEVFNSCPSVKSDVAYIGVVKKPLFTIQPELLGYYCESDTIVISAAFATEIAVDSVRWFYGNQPLKDGVHFAGSGTTKLTVKGLKAADAVNRFYLVAYNHCGQAQSTSVKVDLHYPARFVRNSSNDVELILCGGEDQVLYVSATGSDTIRYTWTYNGKIVADGYSNRLTVEGGGLDNSGEYVCQIQNGCGNDRTVSYVKQSMPPLSDFEGGGHYCANGEGVEACLLSPKKHINYQLYLKKVSGKGTSIGDKVSGDTVVGDICYTDLLKGTYYVMASDTNSCERVMDGEVVVVEDPLPIDYKLKIARQICVGEPDGDLVLENSQTGIMYYLCKYNGAAWDTLSTPYHGTGKEMPLNHISAGQYKLVGYNPLTGCRVGLTTVVTLTERPLPLLYDLLFKNNDSTYCANVQSNVVLQYSQSTGGYSYQLKSGGRNYGVAQTGSPVLWSGLPQGVYAMEVTNEWGCKSQIAGKEVKAQLSPVVYSLKGDRYFCPDVVSKQIVFTGSDAGYIYQLRSLSGRVTVDSIGTGRHISFEVPAASDRFHVIVTDNTREKCRSYSDTLVIERSNIKAVSRTISADYGTTVQLGVNVNGYIGREENLVYQWDNADKINGSTSVKNPRTTVITESRLYKVIITDSIGCTDSATVLVRCYGGPLTGEIRLSDCMTDAGDTVLICLGAKIDFCGMVSGGFENRGFNYLWWDRSGTLGTSSSLSDYAPETDGYLYWRVVNGTDIVVDSVWITVHSLDYPGNLPVLNKRGYACGDSTVFLSIGENRNEMTYTLKKDGVAYTCLISATDSIIWTLSPAVPGVYTVEISDGSCKVVLPNSVKVYPVPLKKFLEGDSVYCEGSLASLWVRNAEKGVDYWLYDKVSGNQVKKGIQQGKDVIFSGIGNGSYYVKAVAGECETIGGSVTVKRVPLPDISLNVSFKDSGKACAGSDNFIKVEGTESGKKYTLHKKGKTDVIDSFYGNGSDMTFKALSAAGVYVVAVKDTLSGCEALLSQALTIEPAPAMPVVLGCSYCESVSGIGCGISISYKNRGVYYRLTDGVVELDTLFAGDGYQFRALTEGRYRVIAEDSLTKCVSPAVEVGIESVSSPRVLSVNGGCTLLNSTAVISTTVAGEGDSIRYVLYKDGVRTDKAQVGTGNIISFGSLPGAGVYRIWAENSLGCGVFMEGSVTVFPNLVLAGDSLYVNGVYCGDNGKEVTLSYPGSSYLWRYYVTDGSLCSDTLKGNGKELRFNRIDRKPIRPGYYKLYAVSPCGAEVKMVATGTVALHKIPGIQAMEPDSAVLCSGEKFEIRLDNSESTVKYQVRYYSLSGDYVKSYGYVPGSGSALSVGDFSATGIYKVYADNGCVVLIDSLVAIGGKEPAKKILLGDEACVVGGTTSGLHLSVSDREADVAYYLYKDNVSIVDSLTPIFRPGTNEFQVQAQIGCYQAVATHEQSGCRKMLEGVRCIGGITETFGLLPQTDDTVKICDKTKYCISLDGSEKGVRYILYRNGKDFVQELGGTGSRLDYACVSESGSYQVKAKVATCEQWMNDTILLQVVSKPSLALNDTFPYCEGEGGVHIRLLTTQPSLTYRLYTPDGRQETRKGAVNHGGLEFTDLSNLKGYYYVEAYDSIVGCYAKDSTVVKMEKLPRAYDLTAIQGHYICVNTSSTLRLSGSEKDVEYGVFRTDDPICIQRKQGTGSAIEFAKIKTPGVYYIEATKKTGEKCQNVFGSWELKLADTVKVHSLVSIKDAYCYTDANKGTIGLDGSNGGVNYELMRDGESTGLIKKGTGAALMWTGVAGKACVGTPGEVNNGYKYSIIARDTLSGCIVYMRGLDTLIESGNIAVWSYQPNESIEKCEGERVDFNVLTSGCGEVYTWYHADTVIYRGKRNYYNINNVTVENAGTYYCNVENACSNAKTPDVSLAVRKNVELSEPMKEVWACTNGENVMISSGFVNANGYYWYKLGAPDRCLSTKDYLVLTNFTASMAGKYVCRAGGSALDCNVVYDTCEVVYGEYPVISGVTEIDTLCVGSAWQTAVVSVNNSMSVKWKHNEDILNFSGACYTVAPVRVEDAGNYIVEATNKCGTKTLVVGKLYVDQPLNVDTVSPALQVGCLGTEKELFIKLSPTNGQEKYEWVLDGRVVGRKNVYRIPPYTKGGTYSYQVWYSNKCTSGVSYKEISIHVPEKLEFIEPERTIGVCAGDRDSAQLLVTIDPSLMANFRWYFQKSAETTDRVDLNCTTNSYTVALSRANTGYYYCNVYNECESKTTQTTWVRVDTIPTLGVALTNDTVCANTDYTLEIDADGGNLKYFWKILKRSELVPEEIEIPLNNQLVIRNISPEYDSCQIWCTVKNDCGEVTGNMMTLRVRGSNAGLKVTPGSVSSCNGLAHKVAVTVDGGIPWSYKYLTPGDEVKQVNVTSGMTDSLEVTESGTYRISWFKDAMGCITTDSLPEINVNISVPSEVSFTGGGDRCEGDTVSVRLNITGGHGPWEITLVRESGDPATELAENDGVLRMYGRDTVITFAVSESEEYYIYQAIKDLGSSCLGKLQSARVQVEVHTPLHIDFRTGWPTHIGQCNDANLRDLLKPTIDGVGVTKGGFYINDKPLNGSVWLKRDLYADCYKVAYYYTDEHSCLVTSDEIHICVDSLPYGEITVPEYTCEGVADSLKIELYPAPQDYTVKLYQYRYQHAPGGVKTDFRTIQVPAVKKGLYKEDISWVMTAPVDSCLRYEIVGITDSHGCSMADNISLSLRDNAYRDTVYLRQRPQLDILTRYPDTSRWIWTPYPIDIPRGDSVGVWATLRTGTPQWTLTTSLGHWNWIKHIPVRDTIFWIRDTGVYDFKAQDDYCALAGNTMEVEINRAETGYFRGKLWLEGPYNPGAGSMISNVSGKLLNSYGLSGWPAIVNGQRVIDYIALELRSGVTVASAAELANGAAVISRDTCLLLANGQLADRNTGDTVVGVKNVYGSAGNSYYVVVRHRNHIGMMSAAPVNFSKDNNTAPMLNMTKSANVYFKDGKPGNHMTLYVDIWLLSAGELNDNSLISIFDPNRITVDDTGNSGTGRYDLLHDVNFDGKVDWPSWNGSKGDADWSKVRRNRSKFSDLKYMK